MEAAIERLVAPAVLSSACRTSCSRAAGRSSLSIGEREGQRVFYKALLHFALGALIVAGALEANFSCTGPPDHVAVQIGKSVAFHHVWRGIPLIVTLLGWAWTVKGLLSLIYPKHGLRMLARVSLEKSHQFAIAGVVLSCSVV